MNNKLFNLLFLLGVHTSTLGVHAFVLPTQQGAQLQIASRSAGKIVQDGSLSTSLRLPDSRLFADASLGDGKTRSANKFAGKIIRSLARRTLKTLPSALIAGTCIGAVLPQSAFAFTASDALSSSFDARKLIGTGAAIATAACGLRLISGGQRRELVRLSNSASESDEKDEKKSKIPITILGKLR